MIDLDRVLIIGGSGMVGGQMHFGIKPSHAELDITDRTSVQTKINKLQPSAVINLAGLIDMRQAEENSERARLVNVDGAAFVSEACNALNVPLVHFSTCAVFDGNKNEPYSESDVPHPINIYGETKYEGEQRVLAISAHALIVRTGWLFGGFDKDKKFVHNCFNKLSSEGSIRATNDRFGSPTYIPDLISEVIQLLNQSVHGVVHVVNDSVASYFDIAYAINEIGHFNAEIIPASSRENEWPNLSRGRMESLMSERGVHMRDYREALEEYVIDLQRRI
ncbi:MAG: NAD(P)-dependent oxidoreductase [Candidatus Magasanikbacteria bacterium]|nr:NAD(P)-dependent oxidoreductase [Candidatus Magasanikbacteria bacterium]